MRADLAAAYVDVSVGTFLAEVKLGIWPEAISRGTKGRLKTWSKAALDRALTPNQAESDGLDGPDDLAAQSPPSKRGLGDIDWGSSP
jgi:hypothetical protein